MARRTTRRVTVEAARELDRAMILLQRGKITFGRWVETLSAWCAGEDVSAEDYGTAEPLTARIVARFGRRRTDREVTALQVSHDLAVTYNTAFQALERMCRAGRAERLTRGVYRVRP
jgi:hypothetical protein